MLYPLRVSISGETETGSTVDAEMDALESSQEDFSDLQAEGTVSAETKAALMDRYDLHVRNVESVIASLEAKGKTEEAARLRARLEAQVRIIQSIFEDDDSSSSSSADSSAGSSSDDVHVEDHDSVRMESSDGSVKVDADADATVNVTR